MLPSKVMSVPAAANAISALKKQDLGGGESVGKIQTREDSSLKPSGTNLRLQVLSDDQEM